MGQFAINFDISVLMFCFGIIGLAIIRNWSQKNRAQLASLGLIAIFWILHSG